MKIQKFKKYFLFFAVLFFAFSICSFAEVGSLEQLKDDIGFLVKENQKNMDIGVVVFHVEDGKWLKINEKKTYPLASVFKVPIILELLRQADEGRISLQTNVILKESDKCIGSGVIKFSPAGTVFTLEECLYKMITISDNTATDLIWNLIGEDSVNKLLKRLKLKDTNIYISNRPSYLISLGMENEFSGLTAREIARRWLAKNMDERKKTIKKVLGENENLTIEQFQEIEDASARKQKGSAYYDDVVVAAALDNYGSPFDMALLFLKVYSGEILKLSSKDIFFDALLKQEYNTRIPALLPRDVKVYHKTGTITGVVNDAGLIEVSGNSHIILVVFIKNIKENCHEDAERVIKLIAKYVYEYYK